MCVCIHAYIINRPAGQGPEHRLPAAEGPARRDPGGGRPHGGV